MLQSAVSGSCLQTAMIFAQLFFVFVGLGFLIYGCFVLRKVSRMRSWPSVPAQLLDANIRWENRDESMARRLRVSYRHVVCGEVFTSTRVTVSDFLLATGELQVRYIVRNHLLTGAKAYYDPRNPGSSVLVRPGLALPMIMFSMAAAALSLPLLSSYANHGP